MIIRPLKIEVLGRGFVSGETTLRLIRDKMATNFLFILREFEQRSFRSRIQDDKLTCQAVLHRAVGPPWLGVRRAVPLRPGGAAQRSAQCSELPPRRGTFRGVAGTRLKWIALCLLSIAVSRSMSGCRTVGASNSAARRGSAKGRPLLSAWVPELESDRPPGSR